MVTKIDLSMTSCAAVLNIGQREQQKKAPAVWLGRVVFSVVKGAATQLNLAQAESNAGTNSYIASEMLVSASGPTLVSDSASASLPISALVSSTTSSSCTSASHESERSS